MATVKIETAVVIEALQQALNKLHADYAMQKSLEQEYQNACEGWKKEMIAYVMKNIDKANNFRTNYRDWKDELNVDFDIVVPKVSYLSHQIVNMKLWVRENTKKKLMTFQKKCVS